AGERLPQLRFRMSTNSFWRVVAISILAGASFGVAVATTLAKVVTAKADAATVRAQSFELVDAEGKVIATWGRMDNDRAALTFFDEMGRPRAELGVSLKRASQRLVFWDADQRIRIALTTDANGKPALNMGDESRESRVLLGYLAEGSPPNALSSTKPHSDAWGLVIPKMGALSAWASIGVLRDPASGVEAGAISLMDASGKTWRLPR
ncbi:MAG TPA: hypothetical protein VN673_01680, partial [Clostridia bacterium]|nr:hypothetical protein [Clostridia bacterium]